MTLLIKKKTETVVHITVDGVIKMVSPTETVAAVIAASPRRGSRISVTKHEARAAFCGMGICQECRVMIDGQRRLACQTLCSDGMEIQTAQRGVQ